jgi:hypothetical protein
LKVERGIVCYIRFVELKMDRILEAGQSHDIERRNQTYAQPSLVSRKKMHEVMLLKQIMIQCMVPESCFQFLSKMTVE